MGAACHPVGFPRTLSAPWTSRVRFSALPSNRACGFRAHGSRRSSPLALRLLPPGLVRPGSVVFPYAGLGGAVIGGVVGLIAAWRLIRTGRRRDGQHSG